MINKRTVLSLLMYLAVGACASSGPKMIGPARPAIPVEQVTVYSHAPAAYEEIATLSASTKSVFSPGGPAQIDKVVERLKAQAAQLGANGLILEGFSDAQTASLGTGVGSESYSRNTSVGVGVGGSFGIFKKTGMGRAIYVAPN
jgi:hypothetical protein